MLHMCAAKRRGSLIISLSPPKPRVSPTSERTSLKPSNRVFASCAAAAPAAAHARARDELQSPLGRYVTNKMYFPVYTPLAYVPRGVLE